jgi:excisionase family DNA binding protein
MNYYTIKELANHLNINYYTILRYIKEGKIKAVKIGKIYRIYEEEIHRFEIIYNSHGVGQ